MTKTLWETIPRRIIGYTCPDCHKRWRKGQEPNYCPDCGKGIHKYPIVQYDVPEVKK